MNRRKIRAAAVLACTVLLLGLAGCGLFGAGKSTTEGRIGDSIRTDFFEFTVNSAYLCSEFEGRAASEGTELLVVDATVKNTFNESIPMSDWDFQAQWGEDDDDEAYAFPITSDPETGEEIAAVSEDQLPYEYDLGVDERVEGLLVYEVPEGYKDFSISTQDIYSDGTTGDTYFVYFTPERQ